MQRDITAAITWTKKNIKRHGGDPDNVKYFDLLLAFPPSLSLHSLVYLLLIYECLLIFILKKRFILWATVLVHIWER